MKRLLLVLSLFCFALNGAMGQNPQWDVYQNIANFKSLKLYIPDDQVQLSWYNAEGASGTYPKDKRNYSLEMTIYGDYTVKLFYKNPWHTDSFGGLDAYFTIIGTGILLWQNEHMVIQMDVKKHSDAAYHTLGNGNEIFLRELNESGTYVYDAQYEEVSGAGYFILRGKDIVANRTYGCWYSNSGIEKVSSVFTDRLVLEGRLGVYDLEMKTQSELNAEKSDTYGQWQWNDTRSVIYLESSTKGSYLVLWNNNGDLTWGFQLPKDAVGYKSDKADDGEDLTHMMLSFDGETEQSYSFAKNQQTDRTTYTHVKYDRFMGTMKRDASVIDQIKNKRTLILNYKQNGTNKTAMFQLEGLKAIYDAISASDRFQENKYRIQENEFQERNR